MKSLYLTLLIITLGWITATPQTNRGATAEVNPTPFGKIRAVVVGISHYKNLPNPLQYADADALMVGNYFRSLPQTDSLILLLNEEATATRFKASIDGIVKKSKEGDAVYIYFAGHGNVQQDIEEGFLLFANVTPKDTDYFADDAFILSDLKRYGTLCGKRKVKFILITDACRSGSIFDDKGKQQTLSTLACEWEYTVKLVSCQSNESSFEYPELGGGHGAFTYYLVQGLAGKAEDFENNQLIELGELTEFVNKPVREKTGNRQHPAWSNNAKFQIAPRIEIQLEALAKNNQPQSKTKGEARNSGGNDKESRNGRAQALGKTIEKGKLIHWKDKHEIKVTKSKVTSAFPKTESNTGNLSIDPLRKKIVVLHHKSPTIKFFDIEGADLKPNGTIPVSSSFVSFTPDGQYVLASSWAGELIQFSIDTKDKAKSLSMGTSARGLEFNKAGNKLAAIGSNGKVQLISYPELEKVKTLELDNTTVTSVKFSADDALLFVATKNKKVYAIDMVSNKWNLIGEHKMAVNAVALSPNGQYLYAGDEGGNIVKWDILKGKVITSVRPSGNVVNFHDLSLSDDGGFLLALGKQFSMTLLSTEDLKTVNQFTVTKNGITKAILDQSNQRIFGLTYAGDVVQVEVELNSLDAVTMFQSLRANKALSPQLMAKFQTDLVAELLTAGQNIVKPFIAGSLTLPAPDSIEYGIQVLQNAITVSDGSEVIKEEAESKILFLKGMQILQSNQQEKIADAIALFDQLLKREPRATYPLNAIALAFKKQNEMAKAKLKLSEANKQIDTWTEPLANLGLIALSSRNYEEAKSNFEKIVSLEPASPKGHLLMGYYELALGDFVQASNHFRKALEKSPNDPIIQCELAHVMIRQADFGNAEKTLTDAIRANPSCALAYHYLSSLYTQYFNHHERSVKILFKAYNNSKIALAADANNPDHFAAIAKVLISMAQSLSQDQASEIVAANTPNQSSNWKQSLYQQATALLDSATKKNPYNWQYPALKAFTIGKTRSEFDAIKSISDNRYLSSTEKNICWAFYFMQQKQMKKAEPYLYKVLESNNYPQNFIDFGIEFLTQSASGDAAKWSKFKHEKSPAYWTALAQVTDQNANLTKALQLDINFGPAKISQATMAQKKWTQNVIAESNIDGTPINNSVSITSTSSGKYLTNRVGSILIELPYFSVEPLGNEWLKVSNNSKWGVVSFMGDTLLSFSFDKIRYESKYLEVSQATTIGLYSLENKKWIFQPTAEEIKKWESVIAIKVGGKWGAVDYSGKSIVPCLYEQIEETNKLFRKEIRAKSRFTDHYYTLDGKCVSCN